MFSVKVPDSPKSNQIKSRDAKVTEPRSRGDTRHHWPGNTWSHKWSLDVTRVHWPYITGCRRNSREIVKDQSLKISDLKSVQLVKHWSKIVLLEFKFKRQSSWMNSGVSNLAGYKYLRNLAKKISNVKYVTKWQQ